MKSNQKQYRSLVNVKAIIQHAKELLPSILIKYGPSHVCQDAIEGIIAEAITIASTFNTLSDEILIDPEKEIKNCAAIIQRIH